MDIQLLNSFKLGFLQDDRGEDLFDQCQNCKLKEANAIAFLCRYNQEILLTNTLDKLSDDQIYELLLQRDR